MAKKISDDEDCVLLYQSPGPHRGGPGRTFDCTQAKSAKDVANLLRAGWYRTRDDAYAAADGKPPKYDKAELEALDKAAESKEIEGDDPEKPSESPEADVAFDAVKEALFALREKSEAAGKKGAVARILKQFGVKSAPELKPEQYADVIEAAQKATAATK